MMNRSLSMRGANESESALPFSYRMLEMWGEKVNQYKKKYKKNFEWPTEKKIKRLPKDVYLSSIEFKSDHLDFSGISSVRCILSNGLSSPVFQNEKVNHHHSKKIVLNVNTVKKV